MTEEDDEEDMSVKEGEDSWESTRDKSGVDMVELVPAGETGGRLWRRKRGSNDVFGEVLFWRKNWSSCWNWRKGFDESSISEIIDLSELKRSRRSY